MSPVHNTASATPHTYYIIYTRLSNNQDGKYGKDGFFCGFHGSLVTTIRLGILNRYPPGGTAAGGRARSSGETAREIVLSFIFVRTFFAEHIRNNFVSEGPLRIPIKNIPGAFIGFLPAEPSETMLKIRQKIPLQPILFSENEDRLHRHGAVCTVWNVFSPYEIIQPVILLQRPAFIIAQGQLRLMKNTVHTGEGEVSCGRRRAVKSTPTLLAE